MIGTAWVLRPGADALEVSEERRCRRREGVGVEKVSEERRCRRREGVGVDKVSEERRRRRSLGEASGADGLEASDRRRSQGRETAPPMRRAEASEIRRVRPSSA